MTLAAPGSLARRCIAGGALLMLAAVMLGAFGAHGLRAVLSPQQLHALGLVLVGVIATVTPPTAWLSRAAVLFVVGIALFSGSIYAMTFGAPRWLGMVAPVGGTSFMLGWAAIAVHALRAGR
jgi:uncharacterized membrane protein YgdD (TMEM256/DUF423 family)